MIGCTEDGCDRGAVLTFIEPQTGRGGHLCQLHAEQYAARFLWQSVSARVAESAEQDRSVLLRFGAIEGGKRDG